MGFGGGGPGIWWTECKSDPRFNNSWRCEFMMVSGGPPREAREWIESKRKELDLVELPPDLFWNAMKD